jgi:4-hydroxybenzoyl-CoA reductase subunit beta
MLPLPLFRHHSPASLDEALGLMAAYGDSARLIAGGTDILPNMKHGLVEPEHLVSLGRVDELRGIRLSDDALEIGSMTSLDAIANDPLVTTHAPALAQACAAVGGPHHRRMGTLGGNVCLDTRCVYINQTYFWRQALGFCLKKDGTACHVVESGRKCVAAASNDSGPALMVLDAEVLLRSPSDSRRLSINDFYTTDGIHNTVKRPLEILTAVRVPRVPGRRSAFEKLRRRGAIDFPLLNVAARVDIVDGRLNDADLVVSALAARPKRVSAAAKLARGAAADAALWQSLGDAAFKACKPLSNIDNDAAWRRAMVRVLTRRAFEAAAS